ncbi:MAG: N-acetylmuramoyl-L-alanine amidase [Lachnospiraceae bacterium]|nr:N-acetylmuramoyl-L-alanine amidase [Lachnospiraceae bacterium]
MRTCKDRNHHRSVIVAILALFLIQTFCLSACGLFGGDDEEGDVIITENTTEEAEMPTIIVRSQETFAEDVTEEEPENAASLETEASDILESASEPPEATNIDQLRCEDGEEVYLDESWEYASFSKIHSGAAIYYAAPENNNGLVVGVNAGHGTKGGTDVKTYCHPDMTPKVTGGTTAAGSIEAVAVSGGMSFKDGNSEASVNLRLAKQLRDQLLAAGYNVLMIRDGDDVQLDNIARTVICNNVADIHIAIHFDGDQLDYDKGCFFMSVPDQLKSMPPVDRNWHMSEELGARLIKALGNHGYKIFNGGSMDIDLTQTSYSTIPSVDVEFGNQCSDTSEENLAGLAAACVDGIEDYFNVSN